MGNKKTESPQANSSEWAVGGWSQLFGLGGGLSQEAREGVAARPGEGLPLLHQETPMAREPVPSVPYEGHSLVRAADQPAGLVLWGAGLSLLHRGRPELTGLG